jgi:hypothetical protein
MIEEASRPRKKTTTTVAANINHPSQGLLRMICCIVAIYTDFGFAVFLLRFFLLRFFSQFFPSP